MKRMSKLLFAFAAILLMLFAGATALADTLRFGTVKCNSTVNLRAGASTNTQRIGSYKKDTWVRIIGETGSWYRITGPDGKSGYMMKEYVYISADAKGIVGIVNAKNSLNLRASASSNARVIGSYPKGVPCILLSEQGDWYHVSVDGKAGYFSEAYLTKKYMAYSADVATVVSQNGGSVNIRTGPGKNYGVIKSVKSGSYVMILQQGSGWWKISANGSVGYMDSSYLKDGIVTKNASSSGNGITGGTTGGNTSAGSTVGYAVVDASALYLRAAASQSSRSLGLYGRGTRVDVLEQGAEWCRVNVSGKTGYMKSEYLEFYGMSASATAYVTHPDRTYVNMRNAPSQATGAVLAKVPHGTKVTVLVPGDTWSQIKYNGRTGYMMTRYLDR